MCLVSVFFKDARQEAILTVAPFLRSNASEARRFCHHHDCPANWNSANEINCCVYHANIHSCPLGLMVGAATGATGMMRRLGSLTVVLVSSQKHGGICGPWIPDDGKIVTHTVSKAGKMTQKYWTSKVSSAKRTPPWTESFCVHTSKCLPGAVFAAHKGPAVVAVWLFL